MEIGEVSKRSNLPASTLRHYEDKGLIRSIGRNGIKRVFSNDIVERVAFISLARSAGLSLDEIKNMLFPDGIHVDRELLIAKADELDARIVQLISMRDGLRHAAKCPAPNHFECPKFLRLLKIANQRWNRSRGTKKI
ncbi:MAG: helix-turn-helix domain-containing protein [Pseudomonadota bacterium]